MQNVKFKFALTLSATDSKKNKNQTIFEFYSVHNSSIYGASRTGST